MLQTFNPFRGEGGSGTPSDVYTKEETDQRIDEKITEATQNDAGEIVTGKEYIVDGQTYVAREGAEVFNSYSGNSMNKTIGSYAHAEGTNTLAHADYSHTEGESTKTSYHAYCAHAEGSNTYAEGAASHTEGAMTNSKGTFSHAEGRYSVSGGEVSHAEGLYTKASSAYQHAQGKYNIEDANNEYAFIIGNGTSINARSNAFAIDWQGNIYQNNAQSGINIATALSTKADLENGKIPISQIPPAVMERMRVVADDAARFALTTDIVQNGDTVKVTSTNKMYLVVDNSKLDSEAGYQVYVAGRAAEAVADQNGNVINTTYATKTTTYTKTEVNSITGDKSNLNTTNKTNLVAAINEINTTIGNINTVLEEVL